MAVNTVVRLAHRPRGLVRREDFEIREESLPEPRDGEFRVKAEYISLDPAMRGWMNEGRSYVPPVGLGDVMPKAIRLWEGQPVPALDNYDLLLVLGGAQDTWQTDEYPWLVAEKEAIREWTMVLAKPYIGLCLGHQLLADALGGTVGLASRSEVGVKEVMVTSEGLRHPFFTGISGTYSVVQWHFAEVKTVPPSAAVLAASSDTAVQAMAIDRHGRRPVQGLGRTQ